MSRDTAANNPLAVPVESQRDTYVRNYLIRNARDQIEITATASTASSEGTNGCWSQACQGYADMKAECLKRISLH
ncbi:hypothetical protein IP85_14475 [Rhizobium sp. AAP116]|nr:hypothetical protein IP85_14475 [Rhizobium sp. AAP116]